MHLRLVVFIGICSGAITLSTYADETDIEVSFSWSNCVSDICDVRASVLAPSSFFEYVEVNNSYYRSGWSLNECHRTGLKYSFLVRFDRCIKSLSGISRLPIGQFNADQDLLEPALFFQFGDSWTQSVSNTLVLDCSLYRFQRINNYRERGRRKKR